MNIVVLLGIVITLATGIPVLMQLLKQHPRGLIILFFAEMWERFSYYGMRGILIFYLTQHLLFDDATAGAQYGSYTSLVYLLPLIGGLLADRYLGTRKAVAFGALLLVAGHLTMAVEGTPATQQLVYGGQKYEVVAEGRMESRSVKLMVGDKAYDFGPAEGGGLEIKGLQAGGPLPTVLPKDSYTMEKQIDPVGKNAFYLAISLIIMGVGFLKPNISTIVGQLYPQGDPRRDSGFTLYYYGINLGAFWASVLCGLLGQTVGWWAGFGLAGVGMALGWVVFVLGKPLLQGKGEPPNLELLKAPIAGPINREWLIYILAILGVAPIWLLVQSNQMVGWALGISTVLALAFIGYFLIVKCSKIERERMLLALVLIFGSVVFFTLFEQAGTSLNLFAARNVDLMGISAAQTQSFNAGFILIFAPIFAAMWAWLGARGRDPNPVMKFGFGLLQVGLGFLVVVWAQGFADDSYRLPLIMLALLYMLHTTGELFLSPVGLSQITKLSVASVVSFMMAVWFLASSIAQFVGGAIAGAMGTETVGGQVLDPAAALATSMDGFNKLGWAGVGVGVVFVLLSFFIKHWAHGVNDTGPAQPEPIAPVLDGERQAVSPAAIRADRES
ncbi:peptide ABC transporter [Phenylobacterium sp. Root77]|uniref:peptide MFS transporter n=1 Tax=unclassified Phenylobacterium TaxID=2640670 RepID=UPI0006F789F5|nr:MULTISPECIES: peptide MFS transporter [unclassified Phenylobacterium]KQW73156.1 peptide ABC transporter [Phenylobacterium sp. Root1277]KQW92375.1 peptide ABC transporter [Phenylobacterium sp. Root1290]KRC40605.1 peptide ABC transporter [Phenylobacterium sp. Root77]